MAFGVRVTTEDSYFVSDWDPGQAAEMEPLRRSVPDLGNVRADSTVGRPSSGRS